MIDEQHEIESALLICADDARAIADRIAQLARLGDYRLLSQPDEQLHDVHFDTPDRALAAHRFAFRARTKNGKRLLTLKGEAHSTDWGGVKRTELEVPWSRDGWNAVASQLQQSHITLDTPPNFDDEPTTALRHMEFIVVQSRATHRRVRNIVARDRSSRDRRDADNLLAELAIDAVTYQFDQRIVRLYEIEIEAKSADASDVLRRCVASLTAMYGTTLRHWPHGKLATGLMLERLLRDGQLDEWLDAEHHLTAEGCRAVEMAMRLRTQFE